MYDEVFKERFNFEQFKSKFCLGCKTLILRSQLVLETLVSLVDFFRWEVEKTLQNEVATDNYKSIFCLTNNKEDISKILDTEQNEDEGIEDPKGLVKQEEDGLGRGIENESTKNEDRDQTGVGAHIEQEVN